MTDLDAFTDALDNPLFVVTAAADGEPGGCLVGFASQCSIDPPRFMVWLSTANRTYDIARRASHLAVHVLGREQRPLAALFGGRTGDDTDKFAEVDWQPGEGGAPVLDDCRAWFVGRVEAITDGGDHVGFLLAPVTHGPPAPVRPPLLRLGDVAGLSPGHPA
ncbi:flavin reductase family protein [Streptomyces sp. NPDC057540]|uniref:flavin reductase family protein n=1 Tax=Streptomyces sp. NPDC057540 TaxID=3346160 RepID=UPI0036C88D19